MITDYKPQEKLLSSKGAPTPRIQRWLLKMQPYDYTVQYEPGHKNPGDILSRSPLPYETTNDDTEHHINAINDATASAVSIESHKDDTIKAIMK